MDLELILKKAEELFSDGKMKEVRTLLESAITKHPENPEILNNLGVLFFVEGDLNQAKEFLLKSLLNDPLYIEAALNLGDVLKQSGDLQIAAEIFTRLALEYPENEAIAELATAAKHESVSGDKETTDAVNRLAETKNTLIELLQTGIADRSNAEVSLRPYPYPYKAAFSISSDIDLMTFDAYKVIFSFISSREQTPMGMGLGLPMSNSLFMIETNPKGSFSYFKSTSLEDGEYRSLLDDLIKEGYIDTNHGYGNFSKEVPFTRELAESILEILEKRNLSFPVWTSHGGEENGQMLDSTGLTTFAEGDKPGSEKYHYDLTKQHGTRFVWQWNDSGTSHIIGQDAKDHAMYGTKAFVPFVNNSQKNYLEIPKSEFARINLDKDRLLTPMIMRDGLDAINIRRYYGGFNNSVIDQFGEQINKNTIVELIQNQGSMVLYQHLGAMFDANKKKVSNVSPYLDDQAITNLRFIADCHHDGLLYVDTLSRMATHNLVCRYLDYRVEYADEVTTITIKGLKSPDNAVLPKLSLDDCRGLAFYTNDPERTRIVFNSKTVNDIVINPPDFTGMTSISIKPKRMNDFAID